MREDAAGRRHFVQQRPVARVRQRDAQKVEQRVRVGAVDLDLFGEPKLWLEALARPDVLEAQVDLVAVQVLLVAELIARAANDHEVGKHGRQLVQLQVRLARRVAVRRHVHNQHRLEGKKKRKSTTS